LEEAKRVLLPLGLLPDIALVHQFNLFLCDLFLIFRMFHRFAFQVEVLRINRFLVHDLVQLCTEISQEPARLLALELYREDKVSLGRAAELCQTAFMDFAAKHGVPPLRYGFEDLEEERQTTDRLEP
jgi:predicted HTH domain antitoxin